MMLMSQVSELSHDHEMPLLLVVQHSSQLFPQVWTVLFSMLGHRMVDRFVQDLFFRA